MEPMTNPFSLEQYGIEQLIVRCIICLATVEVDGEVTALGGGFRSRLINLIQEMINPRRKIFFVDHVEADDHVCVLGGFEASVKLTLNMIPPNNLQPTNHNFN